MAAVAAALLLAAVPAGVGQLLARWAPEIMEDWTPEARLDIQTGWMRSALALELPDGTRFEGIIRHLPLLPPGWLAASGQLAIPDAEDPFDVRGRMGLLGGIDFNAHHGNLEIRDQIRLRMEPVRMDLDATLGGKHLTIVSAAFQVDDELGNDLAFADLRADLNWHHDHDGLHAELVMVAERSDKGPSRLSAQARNVDPESAAELIEYWSRAARAERDSATERMAQIGILGAWQALQDAGIQLRLDSLELDGEFILEGRWMATDSGLESRVHGQGTAETLMDWLVPISALSMQVGPDDGAVFADDLLEALTEEGWVTRSDGELVFRYPAPES